MTYEPYRSPCPRCEAAWQAMLRAALHAEGRGIRRIVCPVCGKPALRPGA